MEDLKSIWNFVEKYYPKYSSCDNIAYNDDLQKIKDGELNGQAEIIYNGFREEAIKSLKEPEDFTPTETLIELTINAKVEQEWNESCADIFERAIEGFLSKNTL